MRKIKNWPGIRIAWAAFLTVTLFGLTYSQERLEDESYIVVIEGREYRALPPEKIRELLLIKKERELLSEQVSSINKEFVLYRQTEQKRWKTNERVWGLRLLKEQKQAEFWKSEYEKELKLRTKFERSLRRCSGRILFFRVCV